MLGRVLLLGLSATLAAASAVHAEIINLSCDNGGMLLVFDTGHLTVTDTNPFQQTRVVAPLNVTDDAFAWREGTGGDEADYRMDRTTRLVSGHARGAAISFSNPQCGRSAILTPKS